MEERKLRKKKEKAMIENNYELIYIYSKELADEHLKVEEYELALKEYEESEIAAKKLNNKLYIAIANRMIGETLCFLGEFEKALAHQKVHLNFSREENNLVEEQRALATLGRTYFVNAESFTNDDEVGKQKCLELSRKYYLKSLSICERLASSGNISQKQLSEMKSRLYLNLGLTIESQGKVNEGIDYVAKAINICKHLELWEDLCRCCIAQGSLYMRHGNKSDAILFYDEALKVAERIENRVVLSCEILSLKSDVLVELLDFNGAKQILFKAYKLKTPDMKERTEIEKKLKTIVTICQTENKLLEVEESNHSSKKTLNEILGDCCVKLKLYEKAIECYHKMLESSEALGLTGKDLISSYFSLSQTYKDNGQYNLALKYFEKELEIEKDNPIEACKTLLNIIEILELQKSNFDTLMEKYNEALRLAKKVGDFKAEATVLKSMIGTQKEFNREDLAQETQKELDIVMCCLHQEDCYDKSENSDEEMDFDIDLEELSDLNSDDENDLGQEKHTRRKVTKSFLVRRNEKGETPLHIASAKGNIQLIKSLLKQGHPVNVQDAAGWSPLHEACNHGQVEAARVLIEAGANIDDRGGPECEGITPLHDAAACGHLEVMDMLIDNGASVLVRTNQGETPLDCLLACKERVVSEQGELDSITLAHFNSVVSRLQERLSKAGYNPNKIKTKENSSSVIKSQVNLNETKISQKLCKTIESSRKRCNPGIYDSSNATEEYQNAIQALRNRTKEISKANEIVEKPKVTALLHEEDVGDDWLENDLIDAAKRPAKRRCEQFVGQQVRMSKSSISQKKKKSSTPSKPRWEDDFDNLDLDEIDDIAPLRPTTSRVDIPSRIDPPSEDSSSLEEDLFQSINISRSTKKPKYQKSLLSVGFKRFNPQAQSTQEHGGITSKQTFTSSSQNISPPSISRSQLVSNQMSIKVRVEGKLFLVPVPNFRDDLNIKWLMSETSRRYQNLEGVAPVLSLTTEDGALLDENDPISIVLDKNEIHATVMSWNLAPLGDRYKKACAVSKTDLDEYLSLQLDICQANASLQIRDVPVSLTALTPALKAISYYHNLQKICLSGIFLRDQGFKVVADSICKLIQLRSVDVSNNHITSEGLSYFMLVLNKNPSLQNLEELDFSYNFLGEECVHHLTNMTHHLISLKILKLKCVGLTASALYGAANFNLENIEILDISCNFLEREGVTKFLSSMDSNKVKSLDMSRTGGSEAFRECLLFLDRGHLDCLESLQLADLDLDDNDVEQLIQCLKEADQLSNLDLSCNARITIASHKYFSEMKHLKELNLGGCELLIVSNNLSLPFCKLSLSGDCCGPDFKEAPFSLMMNCEPVF